MDRRHGNGASNAVADVLHGWYRPATWLGIQDCDELRDALENGTLTAGSVRTCRQHQTLTGALLDRAEAEK